VNPMSSVWLWSLAAAVGLSLACSRTSFAARPASTLAEVRNAAKDWNCIVIILDAATAHHFSCYGFPERSSPFLDQLAQQGVRFEHGYSVAPNTGLGTFSAMFSLWCFPSRDAWQMPQGNGIFPGIEKKHYPGPLMRGAGFRTAAFVANKFATHPGEGFDEFFRMFTPSPGLAQDSVRAIPFTQKVGEWVARHKNERFFLWLHYLEPHGPWGMPPGEGGRYGLTPQAEKELFDAAGSFGEIWSKHEAKRDFDLFTSPEGQRAVRLYRLGIRYVDDAIRQLVDRLKQEGVADKTFILLVADHGEGFGEHGFFIHGGSVYEDQVRIPFLAWFPPSVQVPARKVDTAVSLVDILPTLADLFSIKERSPRWEGTSLLPFVFGGKKGEDRAVYGRSWRALMQDMRPAVFSIRTSRYFLRWDTIPDTKELYDVISDPLERNDLSASKPELTQALWKRLKEAVEWGAQPPKKT